VGASLPYGSEGHVDLAAAGIQHKQLLTEWGVQGGLREGRVLADKQTCMRWAGGADARRLTIHPLQRMTEGHPMSRLDELLPWNWPKMPLRKLGKGRRWGPLSQVVWHP
jgi:hypothetical protein